MPTLFKSLAELLEKVEVTRSRLQTTALMADFLKRVEPEEVEPAVSLVLGRPFPKWSQKTLEVSWAILSGVLRRVTGVDWRVFGEAFSKTGDIGSAAKAVYEKSSMRRQTVLFEKPLTILEIRRSLEAMADAEGAGSREKKERLIATLLSQASPVEAKYLVKVFTGEMRTGFHEGLMEQAITKAFDVPLAMVQRASMALGDVGEVAFKAKTLGKDGLEKVGFKLFRPVKLMLAQVADNVEAALKEHGGESAFEYKYDGARLQIHKLRDEVRVFSRRLTDVTRSLPEIVGIVKSTIKVDSVILEGEVVAVNSAGVPIPFQHLMRRFRRVHGIASEAQEIPLRLYLFDVLYLNEESLIPLPYTRRRQILAETAAGIPLTSQIVTADAGQASSFLKAAMDAGQEGLMAKRLDSVYTPGARRKLWLKIKPVLEPLDLVITAAEWGYGRRHGWLSDYYLSARDAKTGEFLTLGKTFKGLTDKEIISMTKQLKEIAINDEGHCIDVLPRIVVEVAYNEIQKSPKYKSQMALRFARITRIREDKTPQDADTIQRVRAIYERQFSKKGTYKTTQ
jgi:DNA ligase-1